MQKTLKVLMIVENLPVPTDPRVWIEAMTLRDFGFQVTIICPKGSTKHRESYICTDGIHIYRYQLSPVGNKYTVYLKEYSIAMLMTFLLSIRVLFRHGFDVIHAANPPDIFFILGLFYKLLGKKYIFDQHDLAPEMFRIKFRGRMKILARLLYFFEKCSYRTASAVIVTNLSQKWNAIEQGKCLPVKVFVVRNGPNLKRLKPVPLEPELKGGRRYLLAYVGAMGMQDGIHYALYAFHNLIYERGHQDISFVLMGDGDYAPKLHALVHKLKLEEYVNFTGWVNSNDLIRYLSVADIGLSPDPKNRLNERSTMIKTMEYMAMEKPIVAFDLIETRFSAQEAALYAQPNSIEDFATKIEMLLEDEDLRRCMGKFGRKRVEEELCWERMEEHLLLTYKMLFPKHFHKSSK